jgi:hypothetical protein
LGSALGISYLPKAVDDSHTNLGWNRARGTLESRAASGQRGAVSVGVRAADLTLLVLRDDAEFATIPLHGLTIEAARAALRVTLDSAGLDPAPWTLNRHYELPPHAVASGAPFDASNRPALEQLSWWFGNASLELERLARTQTDGRRRCAYGRTTSTSRRSSHSAVAVGRGRALRRETSITTSRTST